MATIAQIRKGFLRALIGICWGAATFFDSFAHHTVIVGVIDELVYRESMVNRSNAVGVRLGAGYPAVPIVVVQLKRTMTFLVRWCRSRQFRRTLRGIQYDHLCGCAVLKYSLQYVAHTVIYTETVLSSDLHHPACEPTLVQFGEPSGCVLATSFATD